MSSDFAVAAGDDLPRRRAIRFICLLGAVSLFADATYEGARAITGPFLGALGATATMVGIVAGTGELFGYAVRLGSGYLCDRSGRYWAVTLAGYFINLLSVPLLALAQSWPAAVVLIVAERAGRGVRSPPRDAMLAHAAGQTGLGWGFGLHQALDQTGAIFGPLTVSLILFAAAGAWRTAFAVLLAPALISIALVLTARLQFPRPHDFATRPAALETEGLPPVFKLYLVAVALIAAGYADFALIAYHFAKTGVMAAGWIPIAYALAEGIDGAAGFALGSLYDRIGIRAMVPATLISAAAAPLLFFGGFGAALLGMACWGIGTGAQDSVMRAAIAEIAPQDKRATAFGIYNFVFGVAWFIGSVLLGVLYDVSIPAVVLAAALMQLAALPVFIMLATRRPQAGR